MEIQRMGDRAVLFLGGIVLMMAGGGYVTRLSGILIAFSISCCGIFLEDGRRWAEHIAILPYLFVTLVIFPFQAMVPLILYEVMELQESGRIPQQDRTLSVPEKVLIWTEYFLMIAGLYYYGEDCSAWEMAGAVLLLLAAGWLHWNCRRYRELYDTYIVSRDDSQEITLNLQSRNQYLLEKQDSEIYTATLQERNRIAREIHDGVGHLLSRAILMTGALSAINKDEAVGEGLQGLKESLDEAMNSIRSSVHDLYDESMDLEQAIHNIVKDLTAYRVRLEYDINDVPRQVKYSIIAIVKEGVSNILKHSNGDQIEIQLLEHPAFWKLEIRDNGNCTKNGTENNVIGEKGIGLTNIRDRVEALNGIFRYESSPKGFSVFVSIPKP